MIRHTVCLTVCELRLDPPDGNLRESLVYCPVCQCKVPLHELTSGQSRTEWEWTDGH